RGENGRTEWGRRPTILSREIHDRDGRHAREGDGEDDRDPCRGPTRLQGNPIPEVDLSRSFSQAVTGHKGPARCERLGCLGQSMPNAISEEGEEDEHRVLPSVRQAIGDRILTLDRSEEHTSELQSRGHLVCRLLLEKKNTRNTPPPGP